MFDCSKCVIIVISIFIFRTFQCISSPGLHLEEGGSMDFWNVGILPQHYTEDEGSMDL
jgi:hypothetical protein